MNPDENKNDNSVNGVQPQVPGAESPMSTPPVETPEPTGTTGFDATGDAPGDSPSSSPTVSSYPEQSAQAGSADMSDPSAGLPGSVMPTTPTSSDSVPTPQAGSTASSPSVEPMTPDVVQAPPDQMSTTPAGGSKSLVIVLVVLVVLLAVAAAAYFAGLFG